MNKYTLEKLRVEYEYRKMVFESGVGGDRFALIGAQKIVQWIDEAKDKYFAAIDLMSQKEGARE